MANEYYYPWYPAHYRRDAGHLDHVADSCYRRLLDWYMETGEPIKKDAAKLAHIMGTSPQQFQAVWPQIEGFFNLSPNGYLHHKRCDVELDRQDAFVKQKSQAGIRSAKKRKAIRMSENAQLQLLTNGRATDDEHALERPSTVVGTFGNGPTPNKKEENIRIPPTEGADAPPRAKKILFHACLIWLAELNGKEPDRYRPKIGQWCRDYGEVNTLTAFVAAQKENPQGDRVAYMERLLKPKPRRAPQI